MLAIRLANCVPLTAFVSAFGRSSTKGVIPLKQSCLSQRLRLFASESTRHSVRRQTLSREKTLKERLMAPAGDTAFNLGQGLVAGASIVGLGALCFYGLGLSNKAGAIDRSVMWSAEVRKRIRTTYMYFGSSLAVTAMSAVAISRNPVFLNVMMKNSLLTIGCTLAAMIGSGMLLRSIPYKEGFGGKQMAWLLHSGILGAVVAPLCLLGGPLLVRAAWYTAGVVGGLSTLAICAPNEKFLTMGGPLAIGLGVVFASSIGSAFLPPTTALGAGLYSITLYGGLVLFGMFLLYDTQRIIKVAEEYPVYAMYPYDPINMSIGIYLDTLNIFMRIAMILAGGGSRRK